MAHRRAPLLVFHPGRTSPGAGDSGSPLRRAPADLGRRRDLSRHAVGDRAFRGVLVSGRTPAMDRGVDLEPDGRAFHHIDAIWPGPPLVPQFPQLAVGSGGDRAWMVLWSRAQ